MFLQMGGNEVLKLNELLSKLNESDESDCKIIKQLVAILYRYLEKRGRI